MPRSRQRAGEGKGRDGGKGGASKTRQPCWLAGSRAARRALARLRQKQSGGLVSGTASATAAAAAPAGRYQEHPSPDAPAARWKGLRSLLPSQAPPSSLWRGGRGGAVRTAPSLSRPSLYLNAPPLSPKKTHRSQRGVVRLQPADTRVSSMRACAAAQGVRGRKSEVFAAFSLPDVGSRFLFLLWG